MYIHTHTHTYRHTHTHTVRHTHTEITMHIHAFREGERDTRTQIDTHAQI